MKYTRLAVALSLVFGTAVVACSSGDETSDSPVTGAEKERPALRGPLGKADLPGKCVMPNGTSHCGGQAPSKCWCDDLCSKYGDCCSDAKDKCQVDEPGTCMKDSDCGDDSYCKAEGCDAEGVCQKIPTNVFCGQAITPYCTCDGKTVYNNNTCVFARYDHLGECQDVNEFCGGIAGIQCPSGKQCVDNPDDNCDPALGGADCGGMCVPVNEFCGGIGNIKCPGDKICVSNPDGNCDPALGGADCGGQCVEECGGFAGTQCDDGFTCIDNPDDNCDPNNGGADCGGICVVKPSTPTCQPVLCELFCENGFKTDDDGCEICQCNDPSPCKAAGGTCVADSTSECELAGHVPQDLECGVAGALGNTKCCAPAEEKRLSCEGNCGDAAPDADGFKACFCDDLCEGYGDCARCAVLGGCARVRAARFGGR